MRVCVSKNESYIIAFTHTPCGKINRSCLIWSRFSTGSVNESAPTV